MQYLSLLDISDMRALFTVKKGYALSTIRTSMPDMERRKEEMHLHMSCKNIRVIFYLSMVISVADYAQVTTWLQ